MRRRSEYRQYEQCYRRLPQSPGARILDAGCGKGEWLNWLHAKGYTDLWGFDLSPSDLEAARGNAALHIEEGDAAALLQGRSFDLIHVKDLIEHLTPAEVLEFPGRLPAGAQPRGRALDSHLQRPKPFCGGHHAGRLHAPGRVHTFEHGAGTHGVRSRACGGARHPHHPAHGKRVPAQDHLENVHARLSPAAESAARGRRPPTRHRPSLDGPGPLRRSAREVSRGVPFDGLLTFCAAGSEIYFTGTVASATKRSPAP